MKKGLIEQKIIFLIGQILIILFVGGLMFGYVNNQVKNQDFVYEYIVRDTALKTTALAASDTTSYIELIPVPFVGEKEVYLFVDDNNIGIYSEDSKKKLAYYLKSINLIVPRVDQPYNDSPFIQKDNQLIFGKIIKKKCKPAGFTIIKEHDFNEGSLIIEGTNGVKAIISNKQLGDEIFIKADPKFKKVLCNAEESLENIGIGYFQGKDPIEIQINSKNPKKFLSILSEVLA